MHTTTELLWIEPLLVEFNVKLDTQTLLCDNISAVMVSHNPVLHARTKYIELDIHFVREKVVANKLVI